MESLASGSTRGKETYRFATSSWAARGKREVDLGRAGMKERAQCLGVSLDFLEKENTAETNDF